MRGGYPRLPGAGRRPNPTPPVVPSRYAAAKPTDVSRVAIALESVTAPELCTPKRVKNSPGSSAEGAYRQREGSRCKQDDQVGPPQNAPVRPFAVQKHHMPDASSAASSAGVARGSVRVARATAVPLPARRRHWLLAEPAGRRLCCTSTYDPSFFAAASRWAPRTGRPMPIPRAMIAVSGMMKSPMMLVPPCSDERPTAWIVHYWGLRRKGDRSANLPWPNPVGQIGQSETDEDWASCHCLPCI